LAGPLRKLFTNQDILDAWEASEHCHDGAADILSLQNHKKVSTSLFRYWLRCLTEVTKKNGDPYISTVVLDRKIRNEEMVLRNPTADDLKVQIAHKGCNRILFFTDDHAPFQHPDSIDFLLACKDWLNPDRVLHGGDEVDNNAMNMHESDPNLDAAGPELISARKHVHKLEKLFPNLDICIGNHGAMVYRRAKKYGIPVEYIKSYRDILFPDGGGEGWNWDQVFRIVLPNGTILQVQHSAQADNIGAAAIDRCNLLTGHNHTMFDIVEKRSNAARFWAAHGGCLIDRKSRAFSYTAGQKFLPILGAIFVIDSRPYMIEMELDRHDRWTGNLGGITKWMTLKKDV
jgi:hypothetical protein